MLKTWKDLRDTLFRENISGITQRSHVRQERGLPEKRPLTRSRVLQKESILRPWRYPGRISIDLTWVLGSSEAWKRLLWCRQPGIILPWLPSFQGSTIPTKTHVAAVKSSIIPNNHPSDYIAQHVPSLSTQFIQGMTSGSVTPATTAATTTTTTTTNAAAELSAENCLSDNESARHTISTYPWRRTRRESVKHGRANRVLDYLRRFLSLMHVWSKNLNPGDPEPTR
ncbi:hypothetical protein G5I_10875 [Acromyrmex echinatior]|uniref:Uncharacterized protein n=1 Tax=Acromyrmex echinatior TaxID=103372 RepID=F4WY30_ACREC|nr:hypothetical protein G5I_10875 [Acromyrmex echinatior]